jgi:ferredoxin--NADP+ reductase
LEVATDDGSYGHHGLVTDVLRKLLDEGVRIDFVLAVGPTPMMKAVADLTREHGIPTMVSLNPIMVDGTGMCGGCRVEVGGETKFACVDGPEFDAHQVNFDLLAKRQATYKGEEQQAAQVQPHCKIGLDR